MFSPPSLYPSLPPPPLHPTLNSLLPPPVCGAQERVSLSQTFVEPENNQKWSFIVSLHKDSNFIVALVEFPFDLTNNREKERLTGVPPVVTFSPMTFFPDLNIFIFQTQRHLSHIEVPNDIPKQLR